MIFGQPAVLRAFVLLALLGGCISSLRAELSEEKRRAISRLAINIKHAGTLYNQEKYDECAEVVKKVQASAEELGAGGDADVVEALAPVFRRVRNAHALLELEGIALPKIKEPKVADTPDPSPAPPATAGEGVSFSKQVAPILVAKCGKCHVNDSKGKFSLANYAALMRGSEGGVVIFKGDASGSRIVEVIEEGDMPRGGLKIQAAELETLKKWINEGAKFDGKDTSTNLARLAPGTEAEEAMKVGVTKATGKETISFSRDIAPVLVAQCSGCHVNTTRARGDLNMTTFAQLLEGGESGAPLVPGKPADSLLIKKLKGTGGGEQMPQGKPPLPTDVIAKFEKWIAEGATFDGKSPEMKTGDVANLAKAEAATHEELSDDRKEIAAKNWRLGMPGIDSDTVTTKNFHLVGNVGENTLNQHGELAEAVVPKVAEMLGAKTDEALVKGRITMFFFKQRYDYSEFGKMVEKRSSTPREWKGHWNFTIVDAYGAVIASFEPDYSMEALLGQQVAGVYVASLGDSPRWFSEGAARVVATRLAKDDPRTGKWKDELPEVLRGMSEPGDFINNKLAPESNDIASYSFVQFLMKDRNRFDQLLNAIRSGKEFDKSFSGVYGGSPEQVAARWRQSAGRR